MKGGEERMQQPACTKLSHHPAGVHGDITVELQRCCVTEFTAVAGAILQRKWCTPGTAQSLNKEIKKGRG